jgi:hypothetical protein
MKKDKKGRSYFISGQTTHPKDNPENYTIEVRKRDLGLIVVIGERGIYILDRDLLYKCAEKEWLRYLEKYKNSKRKGSRTKGEIARHPNIIYEDTIREVLKENGYNPCFMCRFIDLNPDKPKDTNEAKEILNKIENIIQKYRETTKV